MVKRSSHIWNTVEISKQDFGTGEGTDNQLLQQENLAKTHISRMSNAT